MREDLTTILDPNRAHRSSGALRVLLADLAALLADRLGASFEITDWTEDPSCQEIGADVRFGPCEAVGSACAAVLAFRHQFREAAHAWACLLGFDEDGVRARPGEQFLAELTAVGWVIRAWGPDANYEWDSYTSDERWRREPTDAPRPQNQYPGSVARLSPAGRVQPPPPVDRVDLLRGMARALAAIPPRRRHRVRMGPGARPAQCRATWCRGSTRIRR